MTRWTASSSTTPEPKMGMLLFVLGGLFVFATGFVIQRGATCMVAAVAELVESRDQQDVCAS